MAEYRLKVFPQGPVFLDPSDDCLTVALLLDQIGYEEDFCVAADFDPLFIANMMSAGFLVMSCSIGDESPASKTHDRYMILSKHHLIRSCLFFPELHIKKSIRKFLPNYELRFDTDFETVLHNCISKHGSDWLTEPLVNAIKEIRNNPAMPVRPVSFALYRDNKLAAGEFGIIAGRVYTSYSGYYDEDNAGTVQMILTARYLEKNSFSFWDLGMPLDYKLTIGAREISRKEFLKVFFG